ncbi:MAG: DUF1153 domain-containing protein [Roseinatronobacter sp.]
MYIKKVDGPRAVTLPDGRVLTLADLPPADTTRWVASRKAVIVAAVEHGLLSRKAALERYALSDEEFDLWTDAATRYGTDALKVTSIQRYRQA